MAFVGIIAKKKNQKELEKIKQVVYPHELIYISQKNLDNMKNIKFETILIQDAISMDENLEKIIQNCQYLIINSDSVEWNADKTKDGLAVITYGYHFKDTVTFSSLTEQNIQVCLQRNIQKQTGEWIEPQEILLQRKQNDEIHSLLEYGTLKILYREKGNKKVEIEEKQ